MKPVFAAAIFAGLALCAVPAIGAGSPVLNDYILKWQDDPHVNCAKQETTIDINVCQGRDYKKVYLNLVKTYNQLYAAYDAGNKKLLLESQIAWEKYQTAQCTYATAVSADGSIHSSMVTLCDAALAKERLKELQAQANCAEGDMGCNHP